MLTERQEEVLDFVREYQRVQGVPPSTREIARRLKFSQPAAAGHLQALAQKGQLEKLADGKWGFKATAVQAQLFALPVFGEIPAGRPALREQEPLEEVWIDPRIFGIRHARPDHFWGLRVTGDSMVGAGILHGDLALMVRREPRIGDIIAALVDETEVTLKRLLREKGKTLLRAANPRYPDIVPQKLEAQGVLVGVIRQTIA
ncbi:MAG TPA: transcriptional repressor LexA [Opitutaceae bacterium]|nr:transcriptional repressor LexA [Opitutaceae bacterium]